MSVKSFTCVNQFPTAPDGAARSVAGPTEGVLLTASTAWQWTSLSFWNGRHVNVDVQTASAYVCFTTTKAVIPITTTAMTSSTATPGVVAARFVQSLAPYRMIVPGNRTILRFKRAGAANALLRVIRS